MSWSQGDDVYKVVFLVGDAPPHMDYEDDVRYAETVDFARAKGIAINTIQCGNQADTAQIWQEIARRGSGQFVAIRQDGAMVALETPLDEELARLNEELAGTVLAYGDADDKAEIERKVAASKAAAPTVTASRLGYLSKSGGRVNSGRRDLVDAVKEGLIETDAVSEDALPSEMQAMNAGERRAYVQGKTEEREKIQARIDELSVKRDTHLRAETERLAAEGRGDGFDQQVLATIRQQAAAKGISKRPPRASPTSEPVRRGRVSGNRRRPRGPADPARSPPLRVPPIKPQVLRKNGVHPALATRSEDSPRHGSASRSGKSPRFSPSRHVTW
jgi:hypothetical protein